MFSYLLAGCQNKSEGVAPSHPAPNVTLPSNQSSESVMKFGETVTSSNGWVATLDFTDSTENTILSNGWTVEVVNE